MFFSIHKIGIMRQCPECIGHLSERLQNGLLIGGKRGVISLHRFFLLCLQRTAMKIRHG